MSGRPRRSPTVLCPASPPSARVSTRRARGECARPWPFNRLHASGDRSGPLTAAPSRYTPFRVEPANRAIGRQQRRLMAHDGRHDHAIGRIPMIRFEREHLAPDGEIHRELDNPHIDSMQVMNPQHESPRAMSQRPACKSISRNETEFTKAEFPHPLHRRLLYRLAVRKRRSLRPHPTRRWSLRWGRRRSAMNDGAKLRQFLVIRVVILRIPANIR